VHEVAEDGDRQLACLRFDLDAVYLVVVPVDEGYPDPLVGWVAPLGFVEEAGREMPTRCSCLSRYPTLGGAVMIFYL
jgi:hypothetical protein